jgi:site-specific DNA-methyltransferase (adenine-specific)
MLELNKIYQGDCLEVMKQIPDGSIDAVITDPPLAQQQVK